MSSSKSMVFELPYFQDSAELFSPIANKPWSFFLDSGIPECRQGRFDIFACDPVCTLQTRGLTTEINTLGKCFVSKADPFLLLKEKLQPVLPDDDKALPFYGGAVGYFGYDLARRLEDLPVFARDAENIPEMAIGIYAWAVVVDHSRQRSWLVGRDGYEINWGHLQKQFSQIQADYIEDTFQVVGEIQSNMTLSAYADAFQRIKTYLREGDCYQVNLAQRFSCHCQGNPWTAYLKLRQLNAAPFSSYLNFAEVQVLSSSPERFLKVIDGAVETKPIKGTRPRLQDVADDQAQIKTLSCSYKDRAENLMIVDLLRNDISKNCKLGSVNVPKLFDVESYVTVHHLVSTVKGMLAEGQHALDLLRNCFPGGSITGAPKIRAMQIIEELEPHRRGIYCGAIGYIGFDGNMDTNIAIRTLVHSDNSIRFWAGGGIVNDSIMEEEYQESFDKAAVMLTLLQHMQGRMLGQW